MKESITLNGPAALHSAALHSLLGVLGEKWSLPVLVALSSGPVNFGSVRRGIDGLSARMLAQTLRRLQGERLVVRYVHSLKPPRVTYSLTSRGSDLARRLGELAQFATLTFDPGAVE
jgi:DNA-binding HxlR family transcriptional regulator